MENWENKIIKEKIDNLQHLPEGYSPNLMSKWEIIEAGLPAQKRKIMPLFKWIAAAAIIGIAFFISILFFTKPTIQIASQLPVHKTFIAAIKILPDKQPIKTIDLQQMAIIKTKQTIPLNRINNTVLSAKKNKILVGTTLPIFDKTHIDTISHPTILNTKPFITIVKAEVIKPAKPKIFQKDFVDEVLTMDKTNTTTSQHAGFKIQINKNDIEESGQSSPVLQWKKSF